MGFTAPEWIKSLEACNDKKRLRNTIINALSDLLKGQIAFIKFKSNIIIDFKLTSFNSKIKPFLSGINSTLQSNYNLEICINSKHLAAKELITEGGSIGEQLQYINWEEWFSISDDEFFNPVDDDLLIKEMNKLEIHL